MSNPALPQKAADLEALADQNGDQLIIDANDVVHGPVCESSIRVLAESKVSLLL
jgi:hypothetical protein